MSGSRPGGLTALAVINFVWAGFASLMVLMMGLAFAVFETVRQQADAEQEFPELWMLAVVTCFYAASASLLIVSGIGYLKQKNVLGRIMGSIWAVVSIGGTVFTISMSNEGFQLLNLIWVIYPVITLVLLNTTFKEDFVNP